MPTSDAARLTRIEQKLDQLADAITMLARVEERMVAAAARMDAIDKRVSAHSVRITDLEKVSNGRGQWFRVFDRLFWIVAAAGVAGLFAYFKSNGTD